MFNLHSFFGGLDRAFLAGLTRDSLTLTVPESVFVMFQLTFAAITPALIVGAFAERMRFGPLLVFTVAVADLRLPAARAHDLGRRRAACSGTGACSISPAAPWCTSTPASPGWWRR